MRLYLDDDSADALLIKLLRKVGHDVQIPSDVNKMGEADPLHFTHAILDTRTVLTKNHRDFLLLHELVVASQGEHSGILAILQDNDPTKDMSPKGIVTAIRKLEAAECRL